MSDYTDNMRRNDSKALYAMFERQRELYTQLEKLTNQMVEQAGKADDHGHGFRHKPETCPTCAAEEKATLAANTMVTQP